MDSRPTFTLPDITDPDGNIFSIIARVSRILKKAGLKDQAAEFTALAMKADSYQDVLSLVGEYCEIE